MLTIFAQAARAQSAPQEKQPPRKLLRLEEMKVEGRAHKPQAMFLMPRANLSHGEPDRAAPLLPKVIKAVEKDPF